MGSWIRGRWVCIFGAPRFSVQRPQNPHVKGFGAIWGKNLGRPKRRSSNHGSNAPLSASEEMVVSKQWFKFGPRH